MRHCAFVGFAICGVAATSPAAADDWAREVGGWTVGRSGDTCVMTMEYEGEGATIASLLIREDTTKTFLSVTNYQWSAEKGERYDLRYHLGKWVYTLPSIGIEDVVRNGFVAMVSDDFVSDFAKADGLAITRGEVLVDDLSLDGSSAGVSVLERCRVELARDLDQQRRDREKLAHIPVDPFASPTRSGREEKGARAPVPLSGWDNAALASYPSAAIREGLQGTVRITLRVSVEGSVVSCIVTTSSGHSVLDEAACEGAQRFGRFKPALNDDGLPVEGIYSTSVRYSLPE